MIHDQSIQAFRLLLPYIQLREYAAWDKSFKIIGQFFSSGSKRTAFFIVDIFLVKSYVNNPLFDIVNFYVETERIVVKPFGHCKSSACLFTNTTQGIAYRRIGYERLGHHAALRQPDQWLRNGSTGLQNLVFFVVFLKRQKLPLMWVHPYKPEGSGKDAGLRMGCTLMWEQVYSVVAQR